jgi:hypothetical protein
MPLESADPRHGQPLRPLTSIASLCGYRPRFAGHVSTYGAFRALRLPPRRARVGAALAPPDRRHRTLPRPAGATVGLRSNGRNRSTANGVEAPTNGSSWPTNGGGSHNYVPTLAEPILRTVQYFSPTFHGMCAPARSMVGRPAQAGVPAGAPDRSSRHARDIHTETKGLQWEYLSDAATRSTMDNADILEVDDAKRDSRRRGSIRIPPDQLVWSPRSSTPGSVTRPAPAQWIEQAFSEQ